MENWDHYGRIRPSWSIVVDATECESNFPTNPKCLLNKGVHMPSDLKIDTAKESKGKKQANKENYISIF